MTNQTQVNDYQDNLETLRATLNLLQAWLDDQGEITPDAVDSRAVDDTYNLICAAESLVTDAMELSVGATKRQARRDQVARADIAARLYQASYPSLDDLTDLAA